ncbi:MAG: M48 family metalloprotease [Patescibacteria group bacterium]|nr:M48 family metalloprotease [Patescibacteria group bacterium]
MPADGADANRPVLTPLPYHEAIRSYLKTEEAEIWQWYASNRVREEQAEAVRFELLKATYRIDRENQLSLYAAAEAAAAKLGLDVPITIYQAQTPAGLNASLAYVPNEAHVVLHGPVASKLSEAELQALLAHELSHLVLWRQWDGEYLVVDQILAALTHDRMAEAAHFATARLLGLYNEIFCDRGALLAAGDPLVVVGMLVKVSTGVEDVSAASYLRQAEEIFSRGGAKAADLTHPEAFIRARAVKLHADGDKDANAKVAEMIEGRPALEELDLVRQPHVAGLTRRLLNVLLRPAWMRSELVVAHARLFFSDYVPGEGPAEDAALQGDLRTDDDPMRDYYCYVLLDFVTADRDLEELPLAAALSLTERLGLKDRFLDIARKELRLRKKQLERIDTEKDALLAKALDHKSP